VPVPPRRNASNESAGKPQASLKAQSFAAQQQKPVPAGTLALAGASQQQ
jgi:hypothetical protein